MQRILKEEHNLSLSSFDSDAISIITRLQRHGYPSYIVGGGVRDILLNKTPKDFDIATEASPKRIKKIIPNSRIIGKRFKIAHVYFSKGKYIEVTTFRDNDPEQNTSDNEDDTNAEIEASKNEFLKSDNTFGDEKTDANRRDITINALLYDPTKETIIDYVGGFKDLQKRTIRIIGEPDSRFKEDPIRLLRVIRHTARSGFKIEKKTWESLKKHVELIETTSPSRLVDEFKKDLVAGALLPFFNLLLESGLARILFPAISDQLSTAQLSTGQLSTVKNHLSSKNKILEEGLLHIDSLSLSDEPPPIRIILAVIFLCGKSNTIFNPEVLKSTDKLLKIVHSLKKKDFQDFYTKITFPRKDISNAFYLVSLFFDILLLAINDKPFTKSLFKYPLDLFEDLILFLKIIPFTPYDKRIIGIASEGVRRAFDINE